MMYINIYKGSLGGIESFSHKTIDDACEQIADDENEYLGTVHVAKKYIADINLLDDGAVSGYVKDCELERSMNEILKSLQLTGR